MAQPPDITETFVREVDENLRRDQIRDFFKDNGSYLVGLLILFLAASGGFIWFQQHRENTAQAHVEQIAQIYKDIGTGNTPKVPQQLDDLSQSSSKAVRATALFTRAAFALQQNNQKLAIATLKTIADDGSLPDSYRNAALIRQTALEFDQLQPQQVIARMQPLAKAGNPWFGSAGEMTALALVKQGKKKEAGELFAAIAKDKSVPQSLRDRSIQIAGSLGADASAALGPQAQ
ncbi:MAG TPA: tetratricopeptide repeat protein [Sphingomicrobium sp.]|nr:tetratricopeptide repeat protein [Sphingomicrobium sp.]